MIRAAFSLRVLIPGLLLSFTASAQSYTWTHFAGRPPLYGVVDGSGAAVRFNSPTGMAVDAGGNVYVTDRLANTLRKISPGGVVSTLAGSPGVSGGTDGVGANALFSSPNGLAVDRAGNLFVADQLNHTIRRIAADGTVTTFAGRAGVSGASDGSAGDARFNEPAGLVFDAVGNLFVADRLNSTIRRITPAGVVSTFAGTAGVFGSTDATGTAARFRGPFGIAIDAAGSLFVADTSSHLIRKITAEGAVTTLAGSPGVAGTANGTGSAARFNAPYGIAVDAGGNIFVADYSNDSIRRITPTGTVSLYAGRSSVQGYQNGARADARFFQPTHLAFSPTGDLFINDSLNHSVRKLDTTETVTLFAGPGGNFGRIDGVGAAALFNYPVGIAVDAADAVVMADSRGNTVRRITPDGVVVSLAGFDGAGYVDGDRSVAKLNYPVGIALAPDGTVYFCEQQVHTIRKISPEGIVTTVAGANGLLGGVDGEAGAARFNFPSGIARDAAGNLYIADSNNHAIRRIEAGTNRVSTFAGSMGSAGSANGTGGAARFRGPTGLRMDRSGDILVADTANHTIRRISSAGVVTTVAGAATVAGATDGSTTAARFSSPLGVGVDQNGVIFVAEGNNSTIRRIEGGSVSTVGGVAGFPNYAVGRGTASRFFIPSDVAVDSQGVVYVGQAGNNVVVRGIPDPVTPNPTTAGRLTNLSVLTSLSSAGDNFTLGYVVGGAGTVGTKNLLIRAAGPALTPLGVADTLADPRLDLFAGTTARGGNDDWGGAAALADAFTRVGAFGFGSPSSRDSAILSEVERGDNTVRISAGNAGTGTVIAEIYDTTPAETVTAAMPRLVNVSVLKHIGGGLTAGFTVGGTGATRVLIRAIGPTLGGAPFGVGGTVADPQLVVFSGQTQIGSNNNWGGTTELMAAFSAVSAFPLTVGSLDAAMLLTLQAGGYTVRVNGVNDTTGIALIEIYEVP